ncbi:ATP-binding protein [Methylobacillus sp. Pita2]|uniref:PAS domain-containing sensor histidine kinase n=1 Tax=Methylobacillus sp. Pita2 TaxID=3383245 RepID=UPI0038B515BB
MHSKGNMTGSVMLEESSIEDVCRYFCLQVASETGLAIVIREAVPGSFTVNRGIVASSRDLRSIERAEALSYNVNNPGPGVLFGIPAISFPVAAGRSSFSVIACTNETEPTLETTWPIIKACSELGAQISLIEMKQVSRPVKSQILRKNDLMLILHPDISSIVFANSVALEKLGYANDTLAEAINLKSHFDSDKLSLLMNQCLRTKADVKAVSYMTKVDGTGFPVDLILSRLDNDGQPGISIIARDLSGKIKYEMENKETINKFRSLNQRMSTTIETERKKIARDVHDEIGGGLSGIIIQLGNILEQVPENERSLFERVLNDCDQVLSSARRISRGLRPDLLDNMGLIPAIEQLLMDFSLKYGIRSKILYDESGIYRVGQNDTTLDDESFFEDNYEETIFCEPSLDGQQKIEIYRIVQEALNNIMKHASATFVRVNAWIGNGNFILVITDNGCGFDQKQHKLKSSGIGLLGMLERARSARGHVMVNSSIGKGTSITVQVKLPEE